MSLNQKKDTCLILNVPGQWIWTYICTNYTFQCVKYIIFYNENLDLQVIFFIMYICIVLKKDAPHILSTHLPLKWCSHCCEFIFVLSSLPEKWKFPSVMFLLHDLFLILFVVMKKRIYLCLDFCQLRSSPILMHSFILLLELIFQTNFLMWLLFVKFDAKLKL